MFGVGDSKPRTGRFRTVLFKPRLEEMGMVGNRVPMEYVAYRRSFLRTDLIPPAYRRNITPRHHHFYEGAFLFKVPRTHPLGKVESKIWDLEFNYEKLDKDYSYLMQGLLMFYCKTQIGI